MLATIIRREPPRSCCGTGLAPHPRPAGRCLRASASSCLRAPISSCRRDPKSPARLPGGLELRMNGALRHTLRGQVDYDATEPSLLQPLQQVASPAKPRACPRARCRLCPLRTLSCHRETVVSFCVCVFAAAEYMGQDSADGFFWSAPVPQCHLAGLAQRVAVRVGVL